MKQLLGTTVVVGSAGCLLLAASYWLPGMRPGDAVGANIGAGAIFGLGVVASVIGIGLGIFGAVTRSGARWTFVLTAAAIAAVAVGVFVVGSAQYV
jgi:hypothetical protein